MMQTCEVAIIGSGFAGSILARVLAALGYDVVLLERGTHPRFAIGESSTPLANLSLERIGLRYGLADCYHLATHGRWLAHFPQLRRGLKRGFTFYRHHPSEEFANRGLESERLLVAASPHAHLSDTHWLRADVDHHFVRAAIAAGVDYRERVELGASEVGCNGVHLYGTVNQAPFQLRANFVIDASGPGGFLAKQLSIPNAMEPTETQSAVVFSHFYGVRLMSDVVPGLPEGPYPDDWAAVHHVIDEGWMYSLRFDDGVTSAGFLLSPRGLASLPAGASASTLWTTLLDRYPTLARAFEDAEPLMPIVFRPAIQHRMARAAGERWALMPHAFAFVDPLFSTGIAWSLRAIERLALAFEQCADRRRVPRPEVLARYESALATEAGHIDLVVAGAYEAMSHFDLFAAQAALYFGTVSFAEVSQRLVPDDQVAWKGFLGVGDPVLQPLARESLTRLRDITKRHGEVGSASERNEFAHWLHGALAPRNVAGLGNPTRNNLYPVDFDELIERHALLGMSREALIARLPALRGTASSPVFCESGASAPLEGMNLQVAQPSLATRTLPSPS
ncbi:MAG TPA: FAD-dependent oxidoreductase [Gemmatimonadaceae bacterium]|nr:FAD-dependent oxidoreductase [Gemmatimonadaceae bacterium]